MRRTDLGRGRAFWLLLALLATSQAEAGASRRKPKEPPPPKVEEAVGDLAYVVSTGELRLEGVGLVVGLENTGADPPPSWYRQKLVDEMRKAGVEQADKLLADPRLSMVLVRVALPVGISTKDRLDVTVEVPPGCGTKSLAGGYLVQTRLRQVLIAGGTPKDGPEMALAQGPIMTGTLDKPDDLKLGRVLGGCRAKEDRPYNLILKDSRRSFKTSALLQSVVNQRFQQHDGVDQKGVATAKTDQNIVLKVPPVYHQNQERYFRVVKLLPVVDSPALRVQRLQTWGKDLLDPRRAGVAALRLEGVGVTAVDVLKTGLASANPQVRFFAAEALAYLRDGSGADVLAEAAVKTPEFRAYALAALAEMDEPVAHMKLRKLMDEADIEVRYGAFNALRAADSRDPFLGRVRVLDDEPEDPEAEAESDSMSVAIGARRRRARPEDPFELYVVDCEGPPLVHIARTRRCEIVVFGRTQKLYTPIVLGFGALLLNAADGDEQVQISKIMAGRGANSDAKAMAPLEVGEVVRRAANLGANYPELVTILQAAYRQKNLPGALVVDAVPASTGAYTAAAILGKSSDAKKDGTKKDEGVSRAGHEAEAAAPEKDAKGKAGKAPRRSLADRLFFWRGR